MAADEAHYIAPNSPNFPDKNWWIDCVGLKTDRLFICFRNGDCAWYTIPLAQAQLHLAALLATNHPGAYVNANLGPWGGSLPYEKAPCPCNDIQGNMTDPGATCELAPTLNNSVAYTFTPIAASGWLRTFITTATFTATWTDPNLPPGLLNFYNVATDDSCAGKTPIIMGGTSPFTGPTAGALGEIIIEYSGVVGPALPVLITISPV